MLKINIHLFKCWNNLSLEVPFGQITLIKGDSGIGKTTIFEAITWCFYGNIREITPNFCDKAKTRVSVEYNGLNITRQREPSKLIVNNKGVIYDGKAAQSFINDLFGNYHIWSASCYIEQKLFNSFLTAPNDGKMELLNSIAFHEEDPKAYIDKIDAHLNEITMIYNNKLGMFNNNLANFNNLMVGVDVSKALSPDQINELTTKINNLNSTKSQLLINIGIKNNLINQLNQINLIKFTIPEPNIELQNLNKKFKREHHLKNDEFLEYIPLLQRKSDLYNELIQLRPTDDFSSNNNKEYTQKDYEEALSTETKYKDNSLLAKSLNVEYNDEKIKNAIIGYQQLLAIQDKLKLEEDKRILENKLNYLEQQSEYPIPEIIPIEISPVDYNKYNTEIYKKQLTELSQYQGALMVQIQHLQKGCDVIQCPHCKCSVRYNQGKLTSSEIEPTNKDDIVKMNEQLQLIVNQIQSLNKIINDLNNEENRIRIEYDNKLKLETQRINQLTLNKQKAEIANANREQQINELKLSIDELREKISCLSVQNVSISAKLLSKSEIDQIHIIIGKLSGIQIISLPEISSIQIMNQIKYQEYKKKEKNYNDFFNNIPEIVRNENYQEIQKYVSLSREYEMSISNTLKEQERISNLKQSLEKQIAEILVDFKGNELEEIDKQINEYQIMIDMGKKANEVLIKHEEITKEREDVLVYNNYMMDLQMLKQHATDTECQVLQQIVDSINLSIQDVCSSMFDKDINIMLNLFRTMKTTKTVKPQVNFTIAYKGGNYNKIGQISGGEGDRISIALTLALSRLSSCPILMLDETLGTIGANLKEAVIKTIREHTNNAVLIIMQDGIEGVFDNIINCDEIRETQPLA